MRTTVALSLCALLAAPPARAQQPAAGQPPFRADVEAVEIDVRVLDERGQPVAGLTAADFEILEDGEPQQIRAFTPVTVPFAARARDGALPEPDTRSNRPPFDGRIYVFVLDDLHTHPLRSQRVHAAVRQFLDRHFAANDRAAIVTTSGRPETVQELTSSRAALLRALDAFMGRQLRSSALERIAAYYRIVQREELPENPRDLRVPDPLEPERAHQARRALTSLRNVAQWLETVPARRKALIFVSEGIEYDLHDVLGNRFASGLIADVQDAVGHAARSNTSIYAIDPRGLGGLFEESAEISGLPDDSTELGSGVFDRAIRWTQNNLQMLAEQTGGFALVNTNDLAGGFDRLVRENSEYYLLGYQPTNLLRDGRFRRVEVRVNRPGLRVVARPGYFAPSAATEDEAAPAATMRALLDSPLPVSDLPMTSAVALFRGEGRSGSALVTVEIGPEFELTEHDGRHQGRIELSIAAVNMDGRVVAADTPAVGLRLTPATRSAVMAHGLRATSRLVLDPGRYQIRIAARDVTSGKQGTVLHDVVVPDFGRTAFDMSGILLGSQAALRAVTARSDSAVQEGLAVPATASRRFAATDVLAVFAELYDNRERRAGRIRVTTTIADPAGRVVHRTEEPVETAAFDPERRALPYRLEIPLRDLAPGDYVLRVAADAGPGPSAAASREVAISVHGEEWLAAHHAAPTNR